MSEELMQTTSSLDPRLCVLHIGENTISEFQKFWQIKETVTVEVKPEESGLLAKIKLLLNRILFFQKRLTKKEEKTIIKPRYDIISIAVCSSDTETQIQKKFIHNSANPKDELSTVVEYIGRVFYSSPSNSGINHLLIISDLTPEYIDFSINFLKEIKKFSIKNTFFAYADGGMDNIKEMVNTLKKERISPIIISEEAISRNNFQKFFCEFTDFTMYENLSQIQPFSFPDFLPSPYDNDNPSILCSWLIELPEGLEDEDVISKTSVKAIKAISDLSASKSIDISNFDLYKGKLALVIPNHGMDFGFSDGIFCDLGNMFGIEGLDILSKKGGCNLIWAFGALSKTSITSQKLSSESERIQVEEGEVGMA